MNLGRHVAESQQVGLSVASEDQAGVEKTIDARSLVCVAAVERKLIAADTRDRTHDAVRFENPDLAVGTERRRHSTEGVSIEESISFEETAFETDFAGARIGGTLALDRRKRMRVKI